MSVKAEVRRRQSQRIERRARPALPRPVEKFVDQVMPESSRRPRGASWEKSNRFSGHWRSGTRLGQNFGGIR